MNIKTWTCEPIQTRSSLNELSENKEGCYEVHMVTYQIDD